MKKYLTIIVCCAIVAVVFCSGCEPKPESKAVKAPEKAKKQTACKEKDDTKCTAAKTAKKKDACTIAKTVEKKDEPATVKAVEKLQINAQEEKSKAEEPKPAKAEPAQDETADGGVAVIVNGVEITEAQIEEKMAPQLQAKAARMPAGAIGGFKKQLRPLMLRGMIEEALLNQKIEEQKIVVTEADLIRNLEAKGAKQNPPLSLADIKEILKARGQDFEANKDRMMMGLAYEKLMEIQWAGKIKVTAEEAKKYYDDNAAKFQSPEQVRASHILIKTDKTDSQEVKDTAKAKVEGLLKQIRNGADFATLAKEHSGCPSAAAGGDLKFFTRGRMVPEFDKATFELEVGQVSDVVETQFGYHVIKVTDRKAASTTSSEEVMEGIIKKLEQTKKAEIALEYMKNLKASADIVYPPGKEPVKL